MFNMRLFYIHYLIFFILYSCGGRSGKTSKNTELTSLKEPLINANKMYIKKESDEIDEYVKSHGLEIKITGTGLRYLIYKRSNKNEPAINGKYAKVNYKISLLNGTPCYSSDELGPKEFLIGHDQVESGLHEGIVFMNVGDKALFILPSHLAHGLVGDENKIPPRSTVVYDIELLAIK